ncbi:MAG TPA: hypothetical protein VHC48_09670, partial [Puia sp.]|nr:hypothetical protein [Puia sp.]
CRDWRGIRWRGAWHLMVWARLPIWWYHRVPRKVCRLRKGSTPLIRTRDISSTGNAWEKITTERRGLVNITRRLGRSQSRRFVWLKKKIRVAAGQTRRVSLGFSDEVWVFINGQLDYVDKNIYMDPIRKEPDGRCSLENAGFNLPLKAGGQRDPHRGSK